MMGIRRLLKGTCVWVVVLSLLVSAAGCAKKGKDEAPRSSDSSGESSAANGASSAYAELVKHVQDVPAKPTAKPSEALLGFAKAVIQADAQGAAAHVVSDQFSRRWLASLMRQQKVTLRFHRSFIKAYGADAWEKFNSLGHRTQPTDAHLTLMTKVSLEQLRDQGRQADASGNAPFEFGSSEGLDGKIVRVDGGWLIDPTATMFGRRFLERSLSALDKRSAAVERFTKAVGYEGISAEDLDIELGRAIVTGIRGRDPGGRHRFRIEDIPGD